MDDQWLFVSGTPLEDYFQEQLLLQSYAPEVMRAVQEQLARIQEYPQTTNPRMVDGEPVHAVKTGSFPAGEGVTPVLLILYFLDHVRHLIHLMHVCKAADVDLGDGGSESESGGTLPVNLAQLREYRDRAAPEPIERVLRRVMAQMHRNHRH